MAQLQIDKEKVGKILIIKLRGIGDVVLSTIALNNLRKDFPNVQIDYLVETPSQAGLSGLKDLSNVLIFERKDFWKKVSLIWKVRQSHYDLVLDFFTNPSTALVTFFSGAKYRVGFPYRGRTYAYNIYGPAERGKYHAAELHLETLKLLGLNHSGKNFYFSISQSALSFSKEYFSKTFSDKDFVIGICPTGGWASKKCDPKKFAEIGDALCEKYNSQILILWGHSDEEDAKAIQRLMKHQSVLAPSTSIQEIAALIYRCKILIANDSGPMHISTAVGTPVLSLHGPTNPLMQGPYGEKHEWYQLTKLDCINCNLLDCPRKHECFLDMPINDILDKVNNLIKKNNLKPAL